MPSITTVTVVHRILHDADNRTDVPQAIKSRAGASCHARILLTSCCALKIMSDMG
jgi:hypothetical protein